MGITQETLLEQLQDLEAQKAEALARVQQISGAEQLLRHLLARLHQPAAPDHTGNGRAQLPENSADF